MGSSPTLAETEPRTGGVARLNELLRLPGVQEVGGRHLHLPQDAPRERGLGAVGGVSSVPAVGDLEDGADEGLPGCELGLGQRWRESPRSAASRVAPDRRHERPKGRLQADHCSRTILRQPPARLWAMMARNMATSASSSIASPR